MGPIILHRLLSTTNQFLCKDNPENKILLKKKKQAHSVLHQQPKNSPHEEILQLP